MQIANTMWSLAALGLLRPPIMKSLVQQLIRIADGQPLHEYPARQLLMVCCSPHLPSSPLLLQSLLPVWVLRD